MPEDWRSTNVGLDSEQLRNAQLIYQIGREMGLRTRDIQIALITAMQESSLRNLNHGDRDSLGLFQQRPSQGWGTPAQVTDPKYATMKFYKALTGLGQRRWDMSMTEAAQAVQRSAYPDAYAKHVDLIRTFYPKISKGQSGRSVRTNAGTSRPDVPTDRFIDQERPVDLIFEDEAGYMPPGGIMGAAFHPALAATTEGTSALDAVSVDDWMPIINAGSIDVIKDSWAAGDVGMSYGKGVDGWRRAVVEAARSALGTPYQWGGNDLQRGVDCSGLIQQAFAKAGIQLPRVSYQQANYGKRVGLKALRPGDLVAWDNSSRNNGADHIAMYIGNGKIIEAARTGTPVRIRRLGDNEGAWGVRIER